MLSVSTVTGQVAHDRAAGIKMMQRGAAGGSPFANLAMGFRYMAGAGVAESCPTSGVYYEAAARDTLTRTRNPNP